MKAILIFMQRKDAFNQLHDRTPPLAKTKSAKNIYFWSAIFFKSIIRWASVIHTFLLVELSLGRFVSTRDPSVHNFGINGSSVFRWNRYPH
jgi:hypothetical protein